MTWAVATAGFTLFRYATAKDLEDTKIYSMVRDALATGAPFSW